PPPPGPRPAWPRGGGRGAAPPPPPRGPPPPPHGLTPLAPGGSPAWSAGFSRHSGAERRGRFIAAFPPSHWQTESPLPYPERVGGDPCPFEPGSS
ncbi:MAG: hypothetical protein F4115_09670, partial [Acidobacteria bacterium]|nr:hypothetical protein [Acidobacteriota bacterium]